MLNFILGLGLLALAFLAVVLRKTYYYLPEKELKRQAEMGDGLARTLYRAVAYGSTLRAYLWLMIGLFSAGGLVLFARVAPVWLGFMVVAFSLWLAFSWLPNTRVTIFGAKLSALVTPVIAWKLSYLHPLLSRAADLVHRYHPTHDHTGLYEADDLVELIDRQQRQSDSRMSQAELDRAKSALAFSSLKVRDVLVPRKQVKTLNGNDPVGLVLLDELHATGHHRFPVYEGKKDQIVGFLQASRLDLNSNGKIGDFIDKKLCYVHENDSLEEALQTFYATKQAMLLAVDNFEDYVGIVTVEDVLKTLAGAPKMNSFDQYEDKKAVASRHAQPSKPVEETTTDDPAEPETEAKISEDSGAPEPAKKSTKSKTEEKLSETDDSVVE